MGSGGKGGGQTTEIPEWLKEPVQKAIGRGEAMSQMEYQPYQGPTVAAFQPGQMQSFRTTGKAMSAFGMAPEGADASGNWMTAGIPEPTEYAGGIKGYSPISLYDDALAASRARDPRSAEIRDLLYAQTPAEAVGPYYEKTGQTLPESTTGIDQIAQTTQKAKTTPSKNWWEEEK